MTDLKFRRVHWLAIAAPIALSLALYRLGFSFNSEKMLTLFLPVVWSIMFALGGGIVFLKRYDMTNRSQTAKKITTHLQTMSFILVVQMVFFLMVAGLYPAHDFLMQCHWLAAHSIGLSSFYECLLFALFLIPSGFSALVGAWCLGLLVGE